MDKNGVDFKRSNFMRPQKNLSEVPEFKLLCHGNMMLMHNSNTNFLSTRTFLETRLQNNILNDQKVHLK